MKNLFKLLCAVALSALLCMACDDGNNNQTTVTYTGYDTDGNKYALDVPEAPKTGDKYTLRITGTDNTLLGTSTGTISSVSDLSNGLALTLRNGSSDFSTTVGESGSIIAEITGDIPLDGGGTKTAPGTLSPTKPSEGEVKTEVNLDIPTLAINTGTKTASWTAVPNASSTNGYTIKIDSTETQVTGTSYDLSNLAAGIHQISVKTNGYETGTHIYNESAYCEEETYAVSAAWIAVTNSTFNRVGSTGSAIYAIAYGNGKFVAGGSDGEMAYSSDGITWTAVTKSTFGTSIINAIAYGNGKFVAGGYDGKMAHSSDGEIWESATYNVFNYTVRAITYGNGKFVAGGDGGRMATSDDGTTWTTVSSSTFGQTTSIRSITYDGEGKFVAGSYSGGMAISTDGAIWTFVPDVKFNVSIGAIAYGSGKFVAVGSNLVNYSADGGITWTAVTDSTFGASGNISGIAYANNMFVAVGSPGRAAYSSDGITWTAVKDSTFGVQPIFDITYGNGKFVAVGAYGRIAYTDN